MCMLTDTTLIFTHACTRICTLTMQGHICDKCEVFSNFWMWIVGSMLVVTFIIVVVVVLTYNNEDYDDNQPPPSDGTDANANATPSVR